MKIQSRSLVLLASACFATATLFGQTQPDPAYLTTFGAGTVVVSHSGFPAIAKYDASQVTYINGVFHIKAGESTTVNMRAIFDAGKNTEYYMNRLKTDKSQNLKHKTAEHVVWRIWCSHDGNVNQVTEKTPWPSKISDIPLWAEPCGTVFFTPNEQTMKYLSGAVKWDESGGNLRAEIGAYIRDANPGCKLYVVFCLAYEYSYSGGETEYKWDELSQKWLPQISAGGIGYVYSDPIAVATIVLD
ncbi:MAG: hypothetical protein KKD31_14825 [Bacteroidetes bacterium]|nr:hypothetical protein [Bacteroidota bacterium]